ncbi:hypothetical protein SCHPADRAFT_1000015 [Schizopora paradoxa]|uniref:F-box domain-containing protein n=1 Tax=Schizopora paradoxa TaxID=27342 RepID=A0A0H2RD10_9AGAM|nr:hypothetical protein SCHPADRAFT_1000015 [Schizopora paradoxa]
MSLTLFSDIPSDIFLQIAQFSPLQSITRLCQVCRSFAEYVHGDKSIWVECLRRDVVEKGIELPKYRPRLSDASAADVRAWVKNAIILNRAYASGRQQPKIQSFVVDVELETTWTKIIRGRWCLAAMSNIFQSFVGVRRIGSSGNCEAMNKFYFPGPITDGVVDDGSTEVRIAFTVATSDAYIQILDLGWNADRDGISLVPVQSIEGARQVFLLKDFIIGFGSLNGDDTYPLVSDWRIQATKQLIPALYLNNSNALLGNIHSECHAMAIWCNHLFVVLNYTVEIFHIPTFESPVNIHRQAGLQSLNFPLSSKDEVRRERGWVGEAFISEVHQPPPDIMADERERYLRIALRDRSEAVFILNLAHSSDGPGFRWKEILSSDDPIYWETLKLCVGSSGEYLLNLSITDRTLYPITLEVIRSDRRKEKEKSVVHEDTRNGIPILPFPEQLTFESTTTMDFDDAAGVIMVGNCCGEIHIIQLVDIGARGSLLDNLPPSRKGSKGLVQDYKTRIPMRLPHCYYLSSKIHDRIVPSVVREEAIESWSKTSGFTLADINPPRGWSKDWRQNNSLQNWVLPFPRWCTLSVDKTFHDFETWNRFIRVSLGSLGDIIPLMYCEKKHDFVIFRIAHRLYYFNRGPYDDDDAHRIWALPFSIQDLSDPKVIRGVELRMWHSGPLCSHIYSTADTMLVDLREEYLWLLEFMKSEDGRAILAKRALNEDPRTWTPTEREEIDMIVHRRWKISHKRMNDDAEREEDDY